MEISNTSNTAYSRPVSQAKGSGDRQTHDDVQAKAIETKPQERTQQRRATQERLQNNNDEAQRRLDGRLINFGQEKNSYDSQQKQVSYNRSRVNEAYGANSQNSARRTEVEQSRRSQQQQHSDSIDIVT